HDFRQPLYELIRVEASIMADQSFDEFTAVTADKTMARRLAVRQGTPLLRRERRVVDTGRRPVEFSVVHYRCDRFRLTLTLRQE
ncbi:MAG: UTRA domain-containing protein, partial [Verrucomicrobiota bacterium]